jgi:hypothetical protein
MPPRARDEGSPSHGGHGRRGDHGGHGARDAGPDDHGGHGGHGEVVAAERATRRSRVTARHGGHGGHGVSRLPSGWATPSAGSPAEAGQRHTTISPSHPRPRGRQPTHPQLATQKSEEHDTPSLLVLLPVKGRTPRTPRESEQGTRSACTPAPEARHRAALQVQNRLVNARLNRCRNAPFARQDAREARGIPPGLLDRPADRDPIARLLPRARPPCGRGDPALGTVHEREQRRAKLAYRRRPRPLRAPRTHRKPRELQLCAACHSSSG